MTSGSYKFRLASAPALWTTVAFSIGIWISSITFPTRTSILVLSISAVCLSFLAIGSHKIFRIIPIAFALFSAGCAYYSTQIFIVPQNHISKFGDINAVRGIIVSFPRKHSVYWCMDFKILAVVTDEGIKSASGLVKLNIKNPGEKLNYGQVWEIDSRVCPLTEQFPNFYVHNNAGYLRKLGYYGNIWANGSECHLLDSERGNFFIREIVQPTRDCIRHAFYSSTDSLQSAILSGLILGGDEDIDPKVIRVFSEAGVIHILSVSGLHVAIIAGFIWWLCQKMGVNRRWSAGVAIIMITFYVLLAQWRPSAVRAGLQAIIVLLAPLLGRRTNFPNSIGVAGLLVLCFAPEQLFALGFQLSFSATLGIAYFYPRLVAFGNSILALHNRVSRFIIEAIAVSLSAQIGTLPIIMYHFHRIQLLAPIANLIAVPPLTPTLVLGLIGGLLWNINHFLGKSVIYLAGWGIKFAYIATKFLTSLPIAFVAVKQQYFVIFALFWLFVSTLVWWKRHIGARVITVLSALTFIGFLIPIRRTPFAVFFSLKEGWAVYLYDGRKDAIVMNCKSNDIDRAILPFLFAQGDKTVEMLAIANPYLTSCERKELLNAISHKIEVEDSSTCGNIAINFISRKNILLDVSGRKIFIVGSPTKLASMSADIVLFCESPEFFDSLFIIPPCERILLAPNARRWRKCIDNYYDLSEGALQVEWFADKEKITFAKSSYLP